MHQQFARFALAVPRLCAAVSTGHADGAARHHRRQADGARSRARATTTCVDAWNYYLQNDNKGRGVVLIGHSQGSGVLNQLIRSEIDGKPMQSKIVSALLLGTNVAVPAGKDVGGAFQNMPLCKSAHADRLRDLLRDVPRHHSAAGQLALRQGARREHAAACMNPAALAGGSGELHSYLVARPQSSRLGRAEAVGRAGAANRDAVRQRSGPADRANASRRTARISR